MRRERREFPGWRRSSNTAVPVWHEARRSLPFVFGSGAAMSAGAIAVMAAPVDHARPARRLALAGALLEGPLMEYMSHHLGVHGEVYKEGAAGRFSNVSRACIVLGTALLARRGGRSRAAAATAGALLNAGALATRMAIFKAGFQSASDPKYVVGPQRAAIDRGERRGAARRQARISAADPAAGSPATAVAERGSAF